VNKTAVGIFGAGSFGKEVMALLPESLPFLFPTLNPVDIFLCFIDDNIKSKEKNGVKILNPDEFLSLSGYDLRYNIAISDTQLRESVYNKMQNSGASPVTLIFNGAQILKNCKIGLGSVVMPGAIISTCVEIGIFSHINFQSYIAHDCKLGDFVTLSPGVICCGNTIIQDGAFIGAGSIIKQGNGDKPRYIGFRATLGMGSNLLVDLPDGKTFIGNPAKQKDSIE
jgi:sugar O-acyltransferase (sialic acid O-acetyltransferase NeuD family)